MYNLNSRVKSRVFTFVLFDNASSYDVHSVLEGLADSFSEFTFVHHNKRLDGSLCVPHYHCVGRSITVKSSNYFHESFNIPYRDITIPQLLTEEGDLYLQCLRYLEEFKPCEG